MSKVALSTRSTAQNRARRRANAARRPSRVGGPKFDHAAMVAALGNKDSRAQRIAYYLDWCAARLPLQYQPFNVIVQEINAYARMPRMDTDEVSTARGSMHSVRRILQQKYQRDLDVGGGGARATVSDEDAAGVVLPKKMKRLRSAKDAVVATHALIDVAEIKDPRIKAYLNKSVREVVRLIGSEDFDKKLLPPMSEEE
jgi:hypothetical protein